MKKSLSVLMIDDNADDRLLCSISLKKCREFDIQLIEAIDADKGLQTLQALLPDCILLDYNLPGKNGFAALEVLHQQYPFIPVIVLTSQPNDDMAVRAIKLGAYSYLSKQEIANSELICHQIKIAIEHHNLEKDFLTKNLVSSKVETEFKQMIDPVSEYAIFKIDPNGTIQTWNLGAQEITGFTNQEAVGQPFTILYSEYDIKSRQAELEIEHATKFSKFSSAGWRYRKDKSKFWAQIGIAKIKDLESKFMGFTVVISDHTKDKFLEDQIQNSFLWQKAILDGANFSIISTNVDGLITSFNSGAERLLGYSSGEMIGKQSPAILHDPNEIAVRAAQLSKELGKEIEPGFKVFVIKSEMGIADENQWTYIHKSGKRISVTLSVTTLRDRAGLIQGYLGIAHDITEQKQAQRDAELFFNAINQVDSVSMSDLHGRITFVNQNFCDICKYTKEELEGQNHRILKSGMQGPEFYQNLWQTISSGKVWKGEVCNKAKDGSIYWEDAAMMATYDTAGKHIGYISIRREITAKKKNEILLEQERVKALASTRAKSQFLANMSHEIRTPMNAIIGMAELLSETPMNDEQRHYVNVFRNAGDNLVEIINNVLDLSRIEAGQYSVENIDFDIENLVESIVDIHYLKAQQKGIEVRYLISKEVAPFIQGDPSKIRQILINLIGNSVKFTPSGSIDLFVRLNSKNPDELIFSVRDTGIGIAQEKLDVIFDKFTQADNSITREYGGSGLGLAISKELTELMGGKISVESTVKTGTTFTFILPYKPIVTEKILSNASRTLDLANKHILIVEDNDINQLIFKEMIGSWNPKLTIVNDPIAALEFLKKPNCPKIDIIVSDEKLPKMSGTDFAQTLSVDPLLKSIPILVISSKYHNTPAVHLPNVKYGIKPIKKRELRNLISDSLLLGQQKKKSILIVEDDLELLSMISDIVKTTGIEVVTSPNGEEALKQFKDRQFDAVLSDFKMPKVNGLELLKELHKQNPNLPFMLFSGYINDETRKIANQLGVTQILEKPIQLSDIADKVTHMMNTASETQKNSGVSASEQTTTAENKFKVLLVDDQPDNRLVVRSFLKKQPVSIVEAENGMEAVDKYTDEVFDLILMDMQMPVLDGYSATIQIRKLEKELGRKNIPIIALTAYALKEEQQKSFEAGCNQHLTKPIKKQTLIDLFNQYYQEKQSATNKAS